MAQTSTTTEYGHWRVEHERTQNHFKPGDNWYIQIVGDDDERRFIGDGKTGKRNARTLAAVMHAAGATDYDPLPPEFGPSNYGDVSEWEEWAAESEAVPARIAGAGKAAIAGYLKVVHREREGWIANRLGVSEQTVRQYLSDLREGRR